MASGLALGLGAQYFPFQSGDLLDSFRIPAYGLLDASIAYRRGRFRLQFNLTNVLNKRYFAGSYNDVYVLPGAPRNARVTADWTF